MEETKLSLDTLGHDEDNQKGDGKDGEEHPKSGLSSVGSVDKVSGRVRSRRALGVRRRQGAVARVVTMVVSLGTLGNRHRVGGVVRVRNGQGGSYGVEELHVVDSCDLEVFELEE
jgi:hypothetical protein